MALAEKPTCLGWPGRPLWVMPVFRTAPVESESFRVRVRWLGVLVGAASLVVGCEKPASPAATGAGLRSAPAAIEALDAYRRESIGQPATGKPWITHVAAVDLDHDGLLDVLACDALADRVVALRQFPRGQFTEYVLASDLIGPVHVSAADLDGDGDLDLMIACMGKVLPNNERLGAVVLLENDGQQHFKTHVVESATYRVTDVEAGDFDGDGRLDLAVAKFGYDQGEVCWLRNTGPWQFERHSLLALPGAINVCVGDLNGDGRPDITALISQQTEEVHLFRNEGGGKFSDEVIFGSTNEDFGSSGISLCDVNRDGRLDVLYTNGDGFDYAEAGSRPWHGIQWLENQSDGFRYHRIGTLPNAYSPVGADFDQDGDIDVVCVVGFQDAKNPQAPSLVLYENDGRQGFTPHFLARVPTHLVTVAAGDFDGNGRLAMVTGGFHAYPPWEQMSRLSLWRRR